MSERKVKLDAQKKYCSTALSRINLWEIVSLDCQKFLVFLADSNENLKWYNADDYLRERNEFPDGMYLKKRKNLFGEDWFENKKNSKPTIFLLREKKGVKPETEKLNRTTTELYGDDDADDNDFEDYDEDTRKKSRKKKNKKRRHHWGKWTQWSSCSVTCGRGRKIRYRKCIAKDCRTGEIEMGEKACQLPACSLLDKLLRFFE